MKKVRESLTDRVVNSIKADIKSGRYGTGAVLPAEPLLTEIFGVSRTVIREALAALRAAGYVESRQGAGVYVKARAADNHGNELFTLDYRDLADILEFLELRMAMEIEAAGLAALRCTAAQQMKIFEQVKRMRTLIEEGESAENADYEFHKGISVATNNKRFVDFFNLIPHKMITRSRFCKNPVDPEWQKAYLMELFLEHRDVYDAIAAKDPALAREKMRVHLERSKARYESLLLELPDHGISK